MRLHRFYISEEIGNKKELTIHSAKLANQLRRVFRLRTGDSIIVFNGTGLDYECKIDGFGKENTISDDSVVRLTITGSKSSRFVPQKKLFLCAAVVKKDTFEWITEKATELGVTDIIPILAEHSEKKSLNEDRLRKISVEASEQSGRGTTPMMHHIMGVEDAVAFIKKENEADAQKCGSTEAENQGEIQMIAFHTDGKQFDRVEFSKNNSTWAVFIGPEGGWSPSEIETFHKLNIPIRCLGPQVLRAETAAIATLSQVVFI